MESISFIIGYLIGRSLSPAEHPVSQRYALFTTLSEQEAVDKIKGAYGDLYSEPSEIVGFDKDGDLVKKVTGILGLEKNKSDSSISIKRFSKEQLLKIEVYDKDMVPIDENAMIAKYLLNDINVSTHKTAF